MKTELAFLRDGGRVSRREDYHKYIFKNGRLMGDFERMYSESKVIPWHQDQEAESWIGDVAVNVLKPFAPYGNALEIGCGLGCFANRVFPLCQSLTGIDVSPTAVAKAKVLFPRIDFCVGDVTADDFHFRDYDLVVVKDLFWYVFPKIDVVMRNITSAVKLRGYLFVFQSFPRLSKRFVGKEVIPTPEALISGLHGEFSLAHSCLLQRHTHPEEGPMFIGLFKRRIEQHPRRKTSA